MIEPHGEELIDRQAKDAEAAWQVRTRGLQRIPLNPRQLCDLYLIANGGFSPLGGFMGSDDYNSVLARMRLANGPVWTIPVVLAVDEQCAAQVREGHEYALSDDGKVVGLIRLAEKHRRRPMEEAESVYRTTDAAHPGVAAMFREGGWLLAGEIAALPRPKTPGLNAYEMEPSQVRAHIVQQGWRTVVGFQTRNPVHRAHEYIQKCALEIVDALLLHPLVGETKNDDIPAEVRMRCYQVLLERYYPRDRTLLVTLPAAMRYAGPREAIFHAIIRKNYGCTHFIVGRDHAGVGNYYGTYDAQRIFLQFAPGELGIEPLFFENSFYCRTCESMASEKTCGHNGDSRLILSGTKVRELLRSGVELPREFTRPEVAQVLREAMI